MTDSPAFDLNAWHRSHAEKTGTVRPVIAACIECKDGFHMSVQASGGHYCSPRRDEGWPYYEWEVGYPSSEDADLLPYAEDKGRPTDTVYGYVPIDVILAVIAKHGGPA